jgi:hypothetical protein
MRLIATQLAKARGINVRERRAKRLPKMDPAGPGVLNDQAAVFPAKNRAIKVIPTNEVDECPDGNDFLPSYMSDAFLSIKSGQFKINTREMVMIPSAYLR